MKQVKFRSVRGYSLILIFSSAAYDAGGVTAQDSRSALPPCPQRTCSLGLSKNRGYGGSRTLG